MKMIRLLFLPLVSLCCCSGQNDSSDPEVPEDMEIAQVADNQPDIQFDTLFHDFGTIIEGEQVVCYFRYENTGSADLIIKSVEATCGCTTPDWVSEPLKPGGHELLKVVFDSKGRQGIQRKRVTVKSNAQNQVVHLTLLTNIKGKRNY